MRYMVLWLFLPALFTLFSTAMGTNPNIKTDLPFLSSSSANSDAQRALSCLQDTVEALCDNLKDHAFATEIRRIIRVIKNTDITINTQTKKLDLQKCWTARTSSPPFLQNTIARCTYSNATPIAQLIAQITLPPPISDARATLEHKQKAYRILRKLDESLYLLLLPSDSHALKKMNSTLSIVRDNQDIVAAIHALNPAIHLGQRCTDIGESYAKLVACATSNDIFAFRTELFEFLGQIVRLKYDTEQALDLIFPSLNEQTLVVPLDSSTSTAAPCIKLIGGNTDHIKKDENTVCVLFWTPRSVCDAVSNNATGITPAIRDHVTTMYKKFIYNADGMIAPDINCIGGDDYLLYAINRPLSKLSRL